MFLEINKADNGKTIIVQALLLNSKQTNTSLGSLSTKTIQIFVFNSASKRVVVRFLKSIRKVLQRFIIYVVRSK